MGEKKKKRVAILTGGSIDLAFARDYLKTYQATVILAIKDLPLPSNWQRRPGRSWIM